MKVTERHNLVLGREGMAGTDGTWKVRAGS